MQPQDWPVWFAWQTQHHREYDALAFNVRLHAGDVPALDVTDPTARAFLDSLAKRIDVVALAGGQADLIEVATTPSPSAIGQLLVYDALWTRQSPIPRRSLILVYRELDPDIAGVLMTLGIRADRA